MASLSQDVCGLVIAVIIIALAMGFNGAPFWLWSIFIAALLGVTGASAPLWIIFLVIAIVFNVKPIRRLLITSAVMSLLKSLKLMPAISATERVALEAGDVWVEKDLFSGKPCFKKILKENYSELSSEEKAFLSGPVDKLCSMVNDWDVWQRRDLSPEAWEFIKKERFFGMIIPREYGGLGFSALAHSEVIMKLAARCLPLGVTVMVPNSLGPAELLNHYGTDEQKKYYLPRLARGEEIPCFALTEPHAGSDAASIQASGVVFRGEDGKLYIRLNWNKRWITLAAISTVLGLAFRLRDPENLLGKGEDVGITCALIPTKTPGVTANRRHDPLTLPIYNCPTQGKDVVVPVDAIIGGVARAGQGWKMLMESLAAGRGISLPAQTTGGVKMVTRAVSAHAVVRKQFGVSIGKFEGIHEPLARIAGAAYMMDATRIFTLGAIDKGQKPPVVTAIAKYHFTEMARKAASDCMDILGGQGISRGPRNLIAHGYMTAPVSITVEGANILTRTLIIFGQGAIRAHPYVFREIDALSTGNLSKFDDAFWAHIGHVVRNKIRAILLTLTRGWLCIPARGGFTAKYYRRLNWASAVFAYLADVSMASLGGKLKFKEKLSGRFADILSWMYISMAVLKRFEAEGRKNEDIPFVKWSLEHALAQIQNAFDGILGNFEAPLIGSIFRVPMRWIWSLNPIGRNPSDKLEIEVAMLLQRPGGMRDRLTSGIHISQRSDEQMTRLENAFRLTFESEQAFLKVRKAIQAGKLKKKPTTELYREALEGGILTRQEYDSIDQADRARNDAIQVDDFSMSEYLGHADLKRSN